MNNDRSLCTGEGVAAVVCACAVQSPGFVSAHHDKIRESGILGLERDVTAVYALLRKEMHIE